VFCSAPSLNSRDNGIGPCSGSHVACERSLNSSRGFTLAELLVTVGILVVLILLFTHLLNSAATITTLGHKQMDADSQARQLLDRMAIDFAQMVKRNDVDYFAKGTIAPNSVGGTMPGNDQIAFYSTVPGYYPSTGAQSPVSLVAYRINSLSGATAFNKMERLGKGLVWNAVSAGSTPVVFMPLTIGVSAASPSGTWPAATSSSLADPDGNYEIIGPQVFRFEYRYLRTSGSFVITPPLDNNGCADLSQISAIVADIAVIDSKSKVLLTNAQITTLAAGLSDYTAGMVPGQLRANWQTALDTNTTLPRPAISGIRLYERYFYLSPPTLLTAPDPLSTATPSPTPTP
jgi:prepilin-type N-terminal cleavage/methylation domain-containing protein